MLLIGCNGKQQDAIIPGKVTAGDNVVDNKEAEKERAAVVEKSKDENSFNLIDVIGICKTDVLNIRELPGLNRNIVGKLYENEKFIIIEDTNWKEEIDGIDANWMLIKKENIVGWVFSGYVSVISENKEVDVSLLPVNKNIQPSYFAGADKVNIGQLPILPFSAFGIEEPYDIPQEYNSHLHYDRLYGNLYILNAGLPDAKILIHAIDPSQKEHILIYEIGKSIQIINDEPLFNRKYDPPVVSLDFVPFAAFKSGTWNFAIKYDEKDEIVINEALSLESYRVTISPENEISPNSFTTNTIFSFKKGDHIHIWINSKRNQKAYFAIYQQSQKRTETSYASLRPKIATKINLTENEPFHIELIVGNDLPVGNYNVAMGEEITNAFLFSSRFKIE
ncbi:MAG: SH3 domain-containing protein [Eubacteriales bacterium]